MLVISTFQIIALIFTMLHIKITSILRGFAFILMLILAIIISVQIGSVISIGEYIPPLALANISEMNSIGWKVKVVPFAVLIISAIISIVLNKIKAKKKNKKDNNYLAINVISHPNIANNIFFRITTYELYRVEGLQYVSVRNG